MPSPRSRVAVLACALFCIATTAQAKQHPPKGYECPDLRLAKYVTRIEKREYVLAKWWVCFRSVRHQKQEGTSGFTPRPISIAGASAGVPDEVSARRRHRSIARGGRPRAWCGWYMRQLFGVSNPAFNLARNWRNFGRPAHGPVPGGVVVWPHHVGKLVAPAGGKIWIVHSGNDGRAVRTRPRSIAGAIAFRVPG